MLQVKAVDNGRPQQSNTARLMFTVLSSPATSAHPPKFVSGHQYAHVMENAQVGHMVQLMSAEDEDGDKLWYSITGKTPWSSYLSPAVSDDTTSRKPKLKSCIKMKGLSNLKISIQCSTVNGWMNVTGN